MKKINYNEMICIILSFIFIFVSLTACGPRFYLNRFNIETSYKEWIKEIGLFSYKDVKVRNYKEENNCIEIDIEYYDDFGGYEGLRDIVNAHNKFVEENPDYFPEDIGIRIINARPSEQVIAILSNFTRGDYDSTELDRECSAKIQRMYIDVDSFDKDIELDEKFDIPVITLASEHFYEDRSYAFLNELVNTEQIILNFEDEDFDREEVSKSIRDIFPNVEIYEYIYDAEKRQGRVAKLQ